MGSPNSKSPPMLEPHMSHDEALEQANASYASNFKGTRNSIQPDGKTLYGQ